MKKLLVGLMLGAVVLSGCGAEEVAEEKIEVVEESRFVNMSHHVDDVEIVKDKETGCKYIVVLSYGHGTGVSMTPLMKNSTEVDCEVE